MLLQYKPKTLTNLIFVGLVCMGLLLTVIKWGNVFQSDVVVINAQIHSHISNFIISMLLYLTVGYLWLLLGISFRKIALLGLLLVAANFLCETAMGFLNTVDILDAVYGTGGVAVGFVFLGAAKRYGMILRKV